MTGLVPVLIPPTGAPTPNRGHRRTGPLPLPTLVRPRQRSTIYTITGVDDRGRVPDLTVVRALGWTADTRLEARTAEGLVLVVAALHGSLGLTVHGHVRLPAPVRRSCGIGSGDRVLLAAEPADGLLVVHPLSSLDAMIGDRHTAAIGGGAA